MDLTLFLGRDVEIINLKAKYHEKKSDFLEMLEIQNKVNLSTKNSIRINATDCTYISPTCLIILSSTRLIANEFKKDLRIGLIAGSKLSKRLKEFGFISKDNAANNNIPLNIMYNDEDVEKAMDKLFLLSPLKDLDEDIQNTFKSKLYEIPNNSLTHSESLFGVIYCGYYTNKKEFWFSIYDLGIGIPECVRKHKADETITSVNAIKWALEKGHTTLITDYPRGMGFTVIEEFRKNCNGTFRLITEDILYCANKDRINYEIMKEKMKGTLFTIKIVL